MYWATIPTGSLPPPSTTIGFEASADSSAVGSAASSSAVPCEACALTVASGAAFSVFVEPLRDTTIIAIKTIATTTAITTRFDDESLEEFLTESGTLAPGVLAGRFTTEGLSLLERLAETAGTTKVDVAFFAVFLAVFLAVFFTALFFTALFFTALFFAVFLAEVFLALFFTALFFTALFFAVFLAEVFLALFFTVFLTATVALLG